MEQSYEGHCKWPTMRGGWCLVALFLVMPAQAQLTIEDPAGDVHANNADDVPPPQPLGIDLVEGVFTFDEDGVSVAITVDDMEDIDNSSPSAGASTEYRAGWEQTGFRDGDWGVRIFYTGSWSNMVEGPCRDGNDQDGCAGGDRDIHDDVPMEVDTANETVHILFPADILPAVNVTWSSFELETSAVQSAYPIFFVDEASDLTAYQMVWPTLEETTPFTEPDQNAADSEVPAGNATRTNPGNEDTPSAPIPAIIGAVFVGAAVSRRRK